MALWYCRTCTAAYAVGLKACPQCGSSDHATRPEDVRREVPGVVEEMNGPPGPAVNALTGEETPAGEPLPDIPAEASPAKRTRARKDRSG